MRFVLDTVAERDRYTAEHSGRVAQIAVSIAQQMGAGPWFVEGIRLMGLLHDLGKIAIPHEILSKPGKLNPQEFDLIKIHPQKGNDLLVKMKWPWPLAQAVLQHHERLDGSGYPNGFSGSDITPEARILAVADVVEAMASHRPYRPSLGIDSAMEEISENCGVLYDREVVEACLYVLNIMDGSRRHCDDLGNFARSGRCDFAESPSPDQIKNPVTT